MSVTGRRGVVDVDVWGHTSALRDAQAAVDTALKLAKLAEATIGFRGLPELRSATAAGPEEVSTACAAVFDTPTHR